MFNTRNLTTEQVQVRDLLNEGKTLREAALLVLGRATKESTIRSWVSKGLLEDEEATSEEVGVVVEDDTLPEVKGEEVSEVKESALEDTKLDSMCDSDDWNVANLAKRLRASQRTNNQLRRVQREVFDGNNVDDIQKTFQEVLGEAILTVNKEPKVHMKPVGGDNTHMLAEITLSDTQFGKLMHGYNTQVATDRVREYLRVVVEDIKAKMETGIIFDKVILALLGDIIESDKKHPNSGRACDTGTAEQLKTSMEVLFLDVITPLALLGVPVDVVCITGNHDHDDHGLNMYLPGSQHLSWPLYHSLRMLSEATGYDHVSFEIPDGAYLIKDIYGFNTLYEHGVGVSTSEVALTKRLVERGNQVRKHMSYIRIGDKHNVSRFNLDTKVVNGATFGRCDDKGGGEYSSISGYAAEPAQLTIYHTPRVEGDSRMSVCGSLLVQLGHITKND